MYHVKKWKSFPQYKYSNTEYKYGVQEYLDSEDNNRLLTEKPRWNAPVISVSAESSSLQFSPISAHTVYQCTPIIIITWKMTGTWLEYDFRRIDNTGYSPSVSPSEYSCMWLLLVLRTRYLPGYIVSEYE